jgi:hypothetical protein
MQSQITCPNCSTPYMAEVHQIIDVGRQPELKQMILSGQLNVAVCPNCEAGGQLNSVILYHDPDHELFMIYVPPELQMDQMQQEQYIGRLTREVLDNTPMEQRRAYMLQPTMILTMQSFVEKVLETEGITKEMIDRQRKQAELLDTLAKADPDVADYLIKERSSEIDETFFLMLKSFVERAVQMDDNEQLLPLVNLQAKLMTETAVGRRVNQRQIAMHALNQDAKAADGLTTVMLLKHVLKNQEDPETAMAIAQAGASAMTYEFFTGLTAEIDKQNMAGKTEVVVRLTQLRADLLQMQEEMQQASQQILQEAQQDLEMILASADLEQAVQANMNKFDDAFMYVLSAEINRAEESSQPERLEKLTQVQQLIVKQIEGQSPPEIQLLTQLTYAETDAQMNQLLDENQDLLSDDLLKIVDLLQDQVRESGQKELVDRLGQVKGLIAARVN